MYAEATAYFSLAAFVMGDKSYRNKLPLLRTFPQVTEDFK